MNAYPQDDLPSHLRRALGEPLMTFVREIMRIDPSCDHERRRELTATYRQAVERAAVLGVEAALAWHTLGVWTEEGKERIGFFSRALECHRADTVERPPVTAKERWCDVHMRAGCLFEIGRIHAHEGDPAVAQGFFEQALPLARAAEALRGQCKPPITYDDRLEGRILELLLQLPDRADGPKDVP